MFEESGAYTCGLKLQYASNLTQLTSAHVSCVGDIEACCLKSRVRTPVN